MSINMISTESAPKAIGPYSQGTAANGFVFVSGQIPVDPETGELAEADFTAQTRRSMLNVQAVLEAAGSDWSKVVMTTVYVSDLGGFDELNKEYASFFESNLPARACVEVAKLPKNVLVEIAAIAVQ